ncbi:MAG: hypothetical protein ACI9RM_000117 [Ulvibacter sp.]|jgi:hypothetical protein
MEHSIFQKTESANRPDFLCTLSKSFELFKKDWEQALYHVLISIVTVAPIILLFYVPYFIFIFSIGDQHSYGAPGDPYITGLIIYVILLLIFIVQAIVLGITAHFFQVLKKVDNEETIDVGGYLDIVKNNFKKLLQLSLATFGIAILATLLCYLPIFYVMVPLNLVAVFYAFNQDLSAPHVRKACFKFGNKFWLIIFGLSFISSIIAQLGVILCFVDVFFTPYFMYVPLYYLYKDTIGFEEGSEYVSLIIS